MRSIQHYLAACLLSITLISPAKAETISVHGSTVVIAAVVEKNKTALEKDSGLTLNIVGNSAGVGLEELAKGEANVAMITGKMEDLVSKINAKTPGMIDPATLKVFEIGHTRVVFAVNPANAVNELSRAQMVSILKGETTNWKQVGGKDGAIMLVTGIAATGLRSAVEKEYLNGESVTEKARTLVNSSLIAAVVEKVPNALGIVVTDMLTPAMKEIKTEKMSDIKMAYVTKGDPTPAAQKLIDATLKLPKK